MLGMRERMRPTRTVIAHSNFRIVGFFRRISNLYKDLGGEGRVIASMQHAIILIVKTTSISYSMLSKFMQLP